MSLKWGLARSAVSSQSAISHAGTVDDITDVTDMTDITDITDSLGDALAGGQGGCKHRCCTEGLVHGLVEGRLWATAHALPDLLCPGRWYQPAPSLGFTLVEVGAWGILKIVNVALGSVGSVRIMGSVRSVGSVWTVSTVSIMGSVRGTRREALEVVKPLEALESLLESRRSFVVLQGRGCDGIF